MSILVIKCPFSQYEYILTKGNSYVGQRLADADDDIVAAVSSFYLKVSKKVLLKVCK